MKPWVYTEQDAEAFDVDDFLNRIAKGEDTDIETALAHARAVFAALGHALSPETVTHLAASLPQTFGPLVAEAVLETLAERIAEGQDEDEIAQQDPLLHPPPRRGMSSASPGGRRMSLEAFLRRVAAGRRRRTKRASGTGFPGTCATQ